MVLMYMMDTEIWYLMWVSVYGTVRGWTLHIGEVPDFNQVPQRPQPRITCPLVRPPSPTRRVWQMRRSFVRAAEQFNAKVLSADVPLDRRPANSAKKSPKKSPRGKSPTGGIAMGDLTEVLLADEEGVARGGLANESLRYFAEVSRDHRRDHRRGDRGQDWRDTWRIRAGVESDHRRDEGG